MITDMPSWWGDIQKYFIEVDYKRTLKEDCPTELKEKYLAYEKEIEDFRKKEEDNDINF